MSGNLHEFIGMASFVSAATFFVVGLRWAILKMGDEIGETTSSSKI
tara:strand:+ start:577 stop:714 length:138 start_codon:yes stop_codon:yes gene_type:complete